MIQIFLEPIVEPVPPTKRATNGVDSTFELVQVVEPALKYGHLNLT